MTGFRHDAGRKAIKVILTFVKAHRTSPFEVARHEFSPAAKARRTFSLSKHHARFRRQLRRASRRIGAVSSADGRRIHFEFTGDSLSIRHISTKDGWSPIHVSDSIALAEEYFREIVDGRLPALIPDTAAIPEAMAILGTRGLPIGSHLGVPIRLRSGQIYGTFCCFNFQANAALDERDLQMMKVVADFVAYQIDEDLERLRDRAEKARRIQALIQSSEEPSIVYQPMFQLSDMTPGWSGSAGALSRRNRNVRRTSGLWKPTRSG